MLNRVRVSASIAIKGRLDGHRGIGGRGLKSLRLVATSGLGQDGSAGLRVAAIFFPVTGTGIDAPLDKMVKVAKQRCERPLI
eukprot:scaffold109416_cov33-Tisochrysis_lutea.AAC.6